MNHEWVPFVNLFTIIAIGVFVVIRSRHWSLPAQSVRIDALEGDQSVLRGNLARVERDLHDWHRTHLETNRAILRELEAIKANGAKEQTIDSDLRQLSDRMIDLEQMISGLPCAEHLAAFMTKVPPKEDK